MEEKVAILDFGSQFTQVIARKIRELGVYTEIFRPDSSPKGQEVKAVILSGGPASVTDHDAPKFNSAWLHIDRPVLGICYGMQLLTSMLGGKLAHGVSREYGHAVLRVCEGEGLFEGWHEGET